MAQVRKYNISGKKIGETEISDELADAKAHSQLIKDYLVALLQNKRQWSANTKGRAEVSHSKKKPHKQKRLGRARQGSLAAPQYRGGGVVFGPKPKQEMHVRINRKERRAAIRALFGEKVRDDRVVVLDSVELKEPKTKVIAQFVGAVGLSGRVLFIAENPKVRGEHAAFVKSCRNLPGVEVVHVGDLNGYALAKAGSLVCSEAALGELKEWL